VSDPHAPDPVVDVDPSPERRPRVGHNPFYLLSVACLLAGVYLITSAIHDEDRLGPTLALLGVVELYQWLLVGLGVWLAQRDGGRDAAQVAVLAIALACDAVLLQNEVSTASIPFGGVLAVVGAGLAAVKLTLLTRACRVRLSPSEWLTAGVAIVGTYALPLAFVALKHAKALEAGAAYLPWWLVAGALVAAGWSLRPRGRLRVALVTVPVVMLGVHAWSMQYVYDFPTQPVVAAPFLLAAAALIARRAPRASGARLACGLVVGWAVAVSLLQPGWMVVDVWRDGVVWSPLRATLLAGAVVCGYGAVRMRSVGLVAAAAALLTVAALGATVRLMVDRVEAMVPDSTLAWGMIAVTAAFALLVVGVLASVLSRPRAV